MQQQEEDGVVLLGSNAIFFSRQIFLARKPQPLALSVIGLGRRGAVCCCCCIA